MSWVHGQTVSPSVPGHFYVFHKPILLSASVTLFSQGQFSEGMLMAGGGMGRVDIHLAHKASSCLFKFLSALLLALPHSCLLQRQRAESPPMFWSLAPTVLLLAALWPSGSLPQINCRSVCTSHHCKLEITLPEPQLNGGGKRFNYMSPHCSYSHSICISWESSWLKCHSTCISAPMSDVDQQCDIQGCKCYLRTNQGEI